LSHRLGSAVRAADSLSSALDISRGLDISHGVGLGSSSTSWLEGELHKMQSDLMASLPGGGAVVEGAEVRAVAAVGGAAERIASLRYSSYALQKFGKHPA
jgi:hypothetical protein